MLLVLLSSRIRRSMPPASLNPAYHRLPTSLRPARPRVEVLRRSVVPENPIRGGFAPEGESGQHHMRCLPSSICLRCSSRICSNRGGSWKSRTSFFVTSSTSPSGVHRAICGCVGATGRCWYGCHGFGQACLGRPGSFNLTRYCGGIEQDFAPIGAGNPALGQGGLRLAVSCANSSIG